jgi:hypothetical protein
MKIAIAFIGFMAILLSLPLSWWLIERSGRDPRARLVKDHRAQVDILSAGTGVGSSASGGFSG